MGLPHGEDGELLRGIREKAELLNSYFTSGFSPKNNSAQPDPSSIKGGDEKTTAKVQKEIV